MTLKIHPAVYPDASQLTVIVGDATVAKNWGGAEVDDDYEIKDDCDFMRVLEADDEGIDELTVGDGKVVIADIGDAGGTPVWESNGAFLMLYFINKEDHKPHLEPIGATAFSAEPKGDSIEVGTVTVESGCLAIVSAAEPCQFTDDQVAAVVSSGESLSTSNSGVLLVKATASQYRIVWERLAHEDDWVQYVGRVRIIPID